MSSALGILRKLGRSKETRSMIKAGLLDNNVRLTDEGKDVLLHELFKVAEYKAALTQAAEDINSYNYDDECPKSK